MGFSSVNLALILFVLLLITGVLWVLDRFYARPRRAEDAPSPAWVEWGAAFFPVVLIVFVLRSFIVEPFQIPTGSMVPTLLEGDFILVNKYTYGIRLPVIDKKIFDIGAPKRGEIMVFRYPKDPSQNYIKRVVGAPGDRIEYKYAEKQLVINGEPVSLAEAGLYTYVHEESVEREQQTVKVQQVDILPKYVEQISGVEHDIIINKNASPDLRGRVAPFPYGENCAYEASRFVCTVPPGHYFAMGDNRDNSLDSRFWGFVPDANIVGRAFFIFYHFGALGRIGGVH
ncbi:MAG: signal peptidase I [Azoarcus sp.]|nr:signal peptidase I [Azoarcus sp.]